MSYTDEETFSIEAVKKNPVKAMDEYAEWFDSDSGHYTESRMAVRAAIECVRQFIKAQGKKAPKKAAKKVAKKAAKKSKKK